MKLIKFEKDGCVPCAMVQNFLDDKEVEFEAIKAFDNPKLAAQHDIGSVPTTILLDNEENEVQRSVGFKASELEEMINRL